MPKLNGIEATKQIKALYPTTAVLILSAYDDDQFIFSLLEAGAAGYLLKTVRGRELIDAIRAVYAGESMLHPLVARKVLNRFMPVPSSRCPTLLTGRRKRHKNCTDCKQSEQPCLTVLQLSVPLETQM